MRYVSSKVEEVQTSNGELMPVKGAAEPDKVFKFEGVAFILLLTGGSLHLYLMDYAESEPICVSITMNIYIDIHTCI